MLHDSNLRNVNISETTDRGTSIHVQGTAHCVYTVELTKFPGNMSQDVRNIDLLDHRTLF